MPREKMFWFRQPRATVVVTVIIATVVIAGATVVVSTAHVNVVPAFVTVPVVLAFAHALVRVTARLVICNCRLHCTLRYTVLNIDLMV
jgi:hypothetical protein